MTTESKNQQPALPLIYRNNWEYDEYYVKPPNKGEVRIKTLNSVKVDGVVFKVTTKRVGVTYNDMGYAYNSHSNHFFIDSVVPKGTKIDLNTLMDGRRVVALDYTPEK